MRVRHARRLPGRNAARDSCSAPAPSGCAPNRCRPVCGLDVRHSRAARRRGIRGSAPAVKFAIAALLIIFTGSLLAIVTRQSDALLAAQLTADHMKCFSLFRPDPGTTMDAAEVERMLMQRFGFDVHVPPSSDAGAAPGTGAQAGRVELVNARRCLYADGRVPHLMYEANGEDMSLFILEGESREPAELTAFGHHTRIWSRGGNTFVLITPAADNSVAAAARYVADQAR